MHKPKLAALLLCLVSQGVIIGGPGAFAAENTPPTHLSQGLDQIFNKGAFWGKQVQLAWENGGDAYTILEPVSGGKGTDIVAYDTATGKRSVQISAAQLTPAGAKEPIQIWDYSWSMDGKKLLVFTNAKKVWREFTRGDYWVYDSSIAAPEDRLIKLGGDAPESSLMFATFSPDGTHVAWVRANNIYVEELATKKITQLTSDGSADIINGTSDWVNEEELFLRNCIRWSPDGKSIAATVLDPGSQNLGRVVLLNPESGKEKTVYAGTAILHKPVWTPDGKFVVYRSAQGISGTRADGGGKPQPLTLSKDLQFPTSFSPDGKRLAFHQDGIQGFDLWTVSIERDGDELKAGTPELFLGTPFAERDASFSSTVAGWDTTPTSRVFPRFMCVRFQTKAAAGKSPTPVEPHPSSVATDESCFFIASLTIGSWWRVIRSRVARSWWENRGCGQT